MSNQQYTKIQDLPSVTRPQHWDSGIMGFISYTGYSTPAVNLGTRHEVIDRTELRYGSPLRANVTADSDKKSVDSARIWNTQLYTMPQVQNQFFRKTVIKGPETKHMETLQGGSPVGYGDKRSESAKDFAKVLPILEEMVEIIGRIKANYRHYAEIQIGTRSCGGTGIFDYALNYKLSNNPTYRITILPVDPRDKAIFKSDFALHELSRNHKSIVIVRDNSTGNLKVSDYMAVRLILAMLTKSQFSRAMDPSDIINRFLDNGNGYIQLAWNRVQIKLRDAHQEWFAPFNIKRGLAPRVDHESVVASAINMLESLSARIDKTQYHLYFLWGPLNETDSEMIQDAAQQLGVELICLPADTPIVKNEKLFGFNLYLIRASTGMNSVACIDSMFGLQTRASTDEIIPVDVLTSEFSKDHVLEESLKQMGRKMGAPDDWFMRGRTI